MDIGDRLNPFGLFLLEEMERQGKEEKKQQQLNIYDVHFFDDITTTPPKKQGIVFYIFIFTVVHLHHFVAVLLMNLIYASFLGLHVECEEAGNLDKLCYCNLFSCQTISYDK